MPVQTLGKREALVSVVVPVYGVERYLARCVDSILAQTYRALEIILVDDGGRDACPQLCDTYADRDARVRVIHKANGGLSDARNAGTAQAQGDSVLFIDSDDWVHPELVAYLLRARQETGAQIAVCDWYYADAYTAPTALPYAAPQGMSGCDAVARMLYQQDFTTCAWGKLYPRSVAQQFLYPVGKNCEDLFTTYKMLYSVAQVAYVKLPLYAYFRRPDSIMGAAYTEKNLDQLDAVDEIAAFAARECPALQSAASARRFSSYCQLWLRLPREKRAAYTARLRGGLSQTAPEVARDKRCRAKNRAAAVAYRLFGTAGLSLLGGLAKGH
ncbi:MAG: glycosyltransferase family 2 protein [Ruthenibacterium sp.]